MASKKNSVSRTKNRNVPVQQGNVGAGKFGTYAKRVMLDAFSRGAPITTACHLAGISTQTYYVWIKRADVDGEEEYVKFIAALRKAKANWELAKMEEIDKGLLGWQSKAWLLERSSPNNFGLKKMDDRMPPEDLALGAIPLIVQALGPEATLGAITEHMAQHGSPKALPEGTVTVMPEEKKK